MLTKTPLNSSYLWWQRFVEWLLPIALIFTYVQVHAIDAEQSDILLLSFLFSFSFSVTAQWLGLYRDWLEFSFFRNLNILIQSVLVASLLNLICAYIFFDAPLSLPQSITWFSFSFLTIASLRALLYFWLVNLLNRQKNQRRVLIIGQGEQAENLAKTLKESTWLGYQYIGSQACLPDEPQPPCWVNDKNYLTAFDQVFICLPMSQHQQIQSLIEHLSNTGKVVKFVPDLFSFELVHSRFEFINGLPVLSVQDSPLNSMSAQLVKRLIDFSFAAILLLVFSPIMLLIALLLKLKYGGPVIFKQIRYGLNGKEITVFKFSSMTVQEDGNQVTQVTAGDSRVTPLGRILRRYNLDELPQLWNVLKGSMSLVGPRPHAKAHNEFYRQQIPSYMARHLVKPGITGWAQVNGWRGETDTLDKMVKRVEFDLYYIKHWSIRFDIKILLLTMWRSFRDPNAF